MGPGDRFQFVLHSATQNGSGRETAPAMSKLSVTHGTPGKPAAVQSAFVWQLGGAKVVGDRV